METQPKTKTITTFMHRKFSALVVTMATFISLMIMTVCIFWYAITHSLDSYLSQQTEVLGSSLATQAAFNATQSILSNDLLSLNVLLNRLVADDSILSARVYNKKDELLAEADSGTSSNQTEQGFRPNDDKRSVYSSSIKFRDEIVGHVLITLDKTPAQATLQHLNNLLIGIAIFTSAIASLFIALMTRWLFLPINQAKEALIAYYKQHKTISISPPLYTEARNIYDAVIAIQNRQQPPQTTESKEPLEEGITDEALETNTPLNETNNTKTKAQFEINFDAIFEESKQRSCVLYFDIINLDEWHKNMTQLQVANLLTPIYRAIFQASDIYLGQVHQYKSNAAMVLFSAIDSEDHLYTNAVSTAQLFLGLVDKLLENELYTDIPKLDFHLGLHQGNPHISSMIQKAVFEPERVEPLLDDVHHMRQSESINKLLISNDIFTLPHIQNRVFTGLPEIIEIDEKEFLTYEVKGMSDKYKKEIRQHIKQITNTK